MELRLENAFLEATIEGSADSVAEVAEQIGWLGAAFRKSSDEDSMSLCVPTIRIYQTALPGKTFSGGYLGFSTRKIADATAAGQCWHKLFRNPIIVEGYPIPKRNRYGTGLEIPISMISSLAESPRLHQFLGRRLLKGFSTAVVPTEKLGDSILWHLHYTEDGSRLPYPDFETVPCVDVGLDEVVKGRHILGWCTEASLHAGKFARRWTNLTSCFANKKQDRKE